jgi:drug/metabolite transporter (DMT)-like permease
MQVSVTYALVAVAAVLWGANFNLAKHVLVDLNALVAGAGRFDIAAVVMLAVSAVKGQRVPLIRHGLAYATLGLVGIAGFNVLFFYGMQMTSAVNGALIMALNPLLTALIACAMKVHRLDSRQLVAFPIGAAGVGIVVLGAGAHVRIAEGDILMVAGNLCWAFYNVMAGKLLPRDVGSLANTTGVMVAGAVALTLTAVAAGAPLTVPGSEALGSLLVMSLGGRVLAYLFWNDGIARLGAPRTALFLTLVPVSSMLISAFEGHPPTWIQLAGGAIVIGAVSLASLGSLVTARLSRPDPSGAPSRTPIGSQPVYRDRPRPHCPQS